MNQLSRETQQKMEGKIISYFHHGYSSYVFLGCTPENPRNVLPGHKPFNPDSIPGCVNALGKNKDIAIQNLVSMPSDKVLNLNAAQMNIIQFKVRDRAKHD
jgi:hypothetical protein